jgi:hypothetical protein
MKKSLMAVAILAVMSASAGAQEVASAASPTASVEAPIKVTKGKMLYATNGGRLGSVYRVADDGSVQLILDGNMRTVPATTLSMVDGKLTTSLSKSDVISR